MENLIKEAAGLISEYDRDLARIFESQPFNRVSIARAFARGLVRNEEDDIHPAADLVLRVAIMDQESRKQVVGA